MDAQVTFRFDRDISIPRWIALYRASDCNQWWTDPSAHAARVYLYTVAQVLLEDRGIAAGVGCPATSVGLWDQGGYGRRGNVHGHRINRALPLRRAWHILAIEQNS